MTEIAVPRSTVSLARVAGIATIVGAATGIIGALVLVLAPPIVAADVFSYPLDATGHAIAQLSFFLNHVLLALGLIALALSPASRARPGRLGAWIALGAMTLLSVCELWAIVLAEATYPSPETAPIDAAYGIASIGLGIGLVLAGIGVARTRVWTGWARWIVLVLGVMVFVVVTPGLMLGFVGGRLALATWMVAWVFFGVALLRDGDRTDR